VGAFVGNVTSPFLRRRKGRIGKDKYLEKVAPTWAGAEIKIAMGNYECMICSPNASGSYQRSANGAESAWTTHALLATLFIGNGLPANGGRARPFSEFFALNPNAILMPLTPVGTHTGFGGTLFRSFPGVFNLPSVGDVAGHPQEDLCWTTDGNCFLSVGAMSANTVKARGGYFIEAPEVLLIPVGAGAGLGAYSVVTIDEPAIKDNFYTWILGFGNGAQPFVRVQRTIHPKGVGAGTWTFTNIANPGTGISTRWLVDGAVVITENQTDKLARSIDYGKTFTAVTSANMGPVHDFWRYGRRYFEIARDTPRCMVSQNKGLTWAANPVAFPSGTFVPDKTIAMPFGQRFILGHDGAVNRCYVHKPFMDI